MLARLLCRLRGHRWERVCGGPWLTTGSDWLRDLRGNGGVHGGGWHAYFGCARCETYALKPVPTDEAVLLSNEWQQPHGGSPFAEVPERWELSATDYLESPDD